MSAHVVARPHQTRSISLRKSARQLLTKEECETFKQALRAFRERSTPEQLSRNLVNILNTPTKQGLITDIALLLPIEQRDLFLQNCRENFPEVKQQVPTIQIDLLDGQDPIKSNNKSSKNATSTQNKRSTFSAKSSKHLMEMNVRRPLQPTSDSDKIQLSQSAAIRKLKDDSSVKVIKLNSATFSSRYKSSLDSSLFDDLRERIHNSLPPAGSKHTLFQSIKEESPEEKPKQNHNHCDKKETVPPAEDEDLLERIQQQISKPRTGLSALQDKGFWALNSPKRNLEEARKREKQEQLAEEFQTSALIHQQAKASSEIHLNPVRDDDPGIEDVIVDIADSEPTLMSSDTEASSAGSRQRIKQMCTGESSGQSTPKAEHHSQQESQQNVAKKPKEAVLLVGSAPESTQLFPFHTSTSFSKQDQLCTVLESPRPSPEEHPQKLTQESDEQQTEETNDMMFEFEEYKHETKETHDVPATMEPIEQNEISPQKSSSLEVTPPCQITHNQRGHQDELDNEMMFSKSCPIEETLPIEMEEDDMNKEEDDEVKFEHQFSPTEEEEQTEIKKIQKSYFHSSQSIASTTDSPISSMTNTKSNSLPQMDQQLYKLLYGINKPKDEDQNSESSSILEIDFMQARQTWLGLQNRGPMFNTYVQTEYEVKEDFCQQATLFVKENDRVIERPDSISLDSRQFECKEVQCDGEKKPVVASCGTSPITKVKHSTSHVGDKKSDEYETVEQWDDETQTARVELEHTCTSPHQLLQQDKDNQTCDLTQCAAVSSQTSPEQPANHPMSPLFPHATSSPQQPMGFFILPPSTQHSSSSPMYMPTDFMSWMNSQLQHSGRPQERPTTPASSTGSITSSVKEFRLVKQKGTFGFSITNKVAPGQRKGIFVSAVVNGSPAGEKGLQPGDELLEIENEDIGSMSLNQAAMIIKHQDSISIKVLQSHAQISCTL